MAVFTPLKRRVGWEEEEEAEEAEEGGGLGLNDVTESPVTREKTHRVASDVVVDAALSFPLPLLL